MRRIILTLWLVGLNLPAVVCAGQADPAAAEAPAPEGLEPLALLGDPAFRHGNTITHVLPMPDGRRLLTAGRDGTVRLWDLASGKELRRFCHTKGADVWNICLLPGKPELLTASEDECVTRWHVGTGEALSTYAHGSMVFRVALHQDGRRFAACDRKNLCILWDLQTGKEIRRFKGHKKSVYTVQFSRDGRSLITGSDDDTVRVWDVETGKQKRRIKNNSGTVYTLAPSPDRSRLLVCCSRKSLWKLDPATGKTIWEAGLPKSVTVAAWSPGGATIGAVCDDQSLYLLKAEDGTQRRRVPLPGQTHWSVAFSLDGSQVMCGAEHLLCRFDPGTGARIFPKPDAPLQYGSVDILLPVPGTRLLLQAGGDKGIRVQNVDTGRMETTWLPKEEIKAMAVSPDGRLLLVGAEGAPGRLLDARTGKLFRKLGHGKVRAAAFTHDGERAVTAGGKQVTFWRVKDGKASKSLSGHESDVVGLAISEDDTLVATTSQDHKLRIWDRHSGSLVAVIEQDKERFRASAFVRSGYGSLLAVSDNHLCYYDVADRGPSRLTDGQIQRLIAQLGANEYRLREQATGKLIKAGRAVLPALAAVKGDDLEVQTRLALIRLKIRKNVGRYRRIDAVTRDKALSSSFSLHPDGRRWAVIRGRYSQAEILIGEINKGRLKILHQIRDPNMPHTVSFGHDGRVYVGNLNGTVSVYSVGPS